MTAAYWHDGEFGLHDYDLGEPLERLVEWAAHWQQIEEKCAVNDERKAEWDQGEATAEYQWSEGDQEFGQELKVSCSKMIWIRIIRILSINLKLSFKNIGVFFK